MPLLQVETGRLYYQIEGAGEPIVFVNDCGLTQTYWYPSVALLKAQFRCVTFDARGFGGSQPYEASAGFDVESQAEDLHRVICSLGLGEAHFVGHGFGGMVAGTCLKNHPQDVKTLTLVNLAIAPEFKELADSHARLGQTVIMCRPLLSLPLIGRLILRRYSLERIPSEYRKWVADDLQRADPRFYWELLASALDEQALAMFWRTLTSTQLPLLLVSSPLDRMSSLAVMRRMYDQVHTATLATMNRAGHFPMLEFTRKFTEILQSFYRKRLPPPRKPQMVVPSQA